MRRAASIPPFFILSLQNIYGTRSQQHDHDHREYRLDHHQPFGNSCERISVSRAEGCRTSKGDEQVVEKVRHPASRVSHLFAGET